MGKKVRKRHIKELATNRGRMKFVNLQYQGDWKKKMSGMWDCWPHCSVVKFSLLCFGNLGLVLGHGPTRLIGGHAVAATHIQNRRRLAQIVAQGQSFSTTTTTTKRNWISSLKSTKKHQGKIVLPHVLPNIHGTDNSNLTQNIAEFRKNRRILNSMFY